MHYKIKIAVLSKHDGKKLSYLYIMNVKIQSIAISRKYVEVTLIIQVIDGDLWRYALSRIRPQK